MSRTSKSPPPASADSSRTRTATRQRSDFNLEPNPFEQSFSATPRSASSNVRGSSPHRDSLGPSSTDSKSDPDRPASRPKSRASQPRSASPSRPLLPPLASISSPADNGFAWGYPPNSINSLRAGPLSPAMLAGPQPSGDQNHVQFDSNYRTGLTPRTGMTPHSGLTPGTGLTPLVGAGAFPPSPNTSAFMAMINNGGSGPTITPNTLNAISGVLNGAANTYSSSNLHQSHSAQDNSNSTFINSANNAASTAANGLFLLSQAHQELTKREEAQARAGNTNAHSNTQTNQPNGKRGTKRKSYDMSSPPPPTLSSNRGGKRTRPPSGRRKPALRGESEDLPDDDDLDDDEVENDMDADDADLSQSGRRGNKKPETEEEKRRNFLERNRQAALKCRQRKKAWLAQLQAKVEYLSNENERLTSALVSSREEISRLSALVGGAGVVGSVPIGQNGVTVGGPGVQPVSMNVNLNKSGPTPVGAGGGGRGGGGGYGY